MSLPDAFLPESIADLRDRIGRLTAETRPNWGRMNVAQMLAHCVCLYDQIEDGEAQGFSLRAWIVRLLFRSTAVGETPFKANLPTPKSFVVADARDFERERARLLEILETRHGRGAAAFEGRRHPTFGPLTAMEWSNLLWKHLDHHLRQFGV